VDISRARRRSPCFDSTLLLHPRQLAWQRTVKTANQGAQPGSARRGLRRRAARHERAADNRCLYPEGMGSGHVPGPEKVGR